MIKIKTLSVDVEKNLSHNYNSVRLRMGTVVEVDVDSPEDFESALVTLKLQLEALVDVQLLKSIQALPRLSKQAKELANDIPY